MELPKRHPKARKYGTNNHAAWIDPCPAREGKHWFVKVEAPGPCFTKYVCEYCGSTTEVDSSN